MVTYNENVIVNSPYTLTLKDKLVLKNTDSWWVDLRCLQNGLGSGVLEVDSYIKCLKDVSAYGGALMTSSGDNSTGGGAVLIGHGFHETSTFPPCIVLTDAGYGTLHIYTDVNTQSHGNLELQSLTTHGVVTSTGPVNITGSKLTSASNYGYLNNSGVTGFQAGSSGSVPVSLETTYRIFCGGDIDVLSDQRDKDLVDVLSARTSLSAIMKLNPLHFTWKPETKKGESVVAGFFAQETAKAIPEAVTVHKGERYSDEHTLNYNVLTTYALSAIQGLNIQCQNSAAKIDAITEEIRELRSTIQRLTKGPVN